MKKEIIVNSSREETRVAILENGVLMDLFVERYETEKIVGNIYKGRVDNILPGISSAFLNIGLEKHGYLYIDDIVTKGKGKEIQKLISKKENLMVQVEKEPISTKGAKVTTDISLPGRFLVYMPHTGHIGISKNIEEKQERERLRNIVLQNKPETGGFIIRTEAEDASEKELKREIKYLKRLWGSINHNFNKAKPGSLLHRDLGVVFQSIRDYLNEDVEIMFIDNKHEFRDALEFVKIVSPELAGKVKQYENRTPIFKAFKIDDEIRKLQSNKVKLPSAGYIIIQEAESLCAVDVNTGKFAGAKSQEETVTITNVEAAREIARQLRLRNIGGIIVIDFIDMRRARNRQKVIETINQAVKGDKAKTKIWPITKLGLVEMSRERKRESYFSLIGEECPMCRGVGKVTSKETTFIKVCQELEQLRLSVHSTKVRIRLAPPLASYFKERINRLKKSAGDRVEVQNANDIDWSDYQIIVE